MNLVLKIRVKTRVLKFDILLKLLFPKSSNIKMKITVIESYTIFKGFYIKDTTCIFNQATSPMCVILKCIVSTLLYISCYTPRMMSNEPENVKRQTLCVCSFLYETIFHHTFILKLISVKRQQLRLYTHLLFSP